MDWTTEQDPLLIALTVRNMPGIGPTSTIKLLKHFPTLQSMAEARPAQLKKFEINRLPKDFNEPVIWQRAYTDAKEAQQKAEALGVQILTFLEPAYPPLLRLIPDFPPILYVKGKLKTDLKNVAIVGTRTPSERYGRPVAQRLTGQFVEHGWGIVSGLALGIDSVAHEQALAMGGYTIAVLANGLDQIYPKENAGLAEQILISGGALISEQPLGTAARPYHLVARDRLQSGLSLATVPIQTDINGGTMHTVRFTLLQKRRLIVPLPPTRFRSEPKNQGIVKLAETLGPNLATVLGAEGKYAHLLQNEFKNKPVARVIEGSEHYPDLFRELDQLLENTQKIIRAQQASEKG